MWNTLPPDLALLHDVTHHVARRFRLAPPDAEDFAQSTLLRALEGKWRVFEKFDGRSSLRTYLTVAVTRVLLDSRNRTLGRWRPSLTAARLGTDAVTLERLMHRDGLDRREAVAVVKGATGEAEAVLARLADDLPCRTRRRILSGDEYLRSLPAAAQADPVVSAEEGRRARAVRARLARAVAELPPDARALLADRYVANRTVRAIAESRGLCAKQLYRKYDRVLGRLKRRLVADTAATVDAG